MCLAEAVDIAEICDPRARSRTRWQPQRLNFVHAWGPATAPLSQIAAAYVLRVPPNEMFALS